MTEAFQTTLENVLGKETVLRAEPMSRHTTFRIGGPADLFVLPKRTEDLVYVLRLCREEHVPYTIIGNGSNLLVHDAGYRGVVIQLDQNFQSFLREGTWLHARAGLLLSRLAQLAAEQGLAGLSFAAGIPGTVGGAVTMNAGAYGGEMADVLTWVEVLQPEDLSIRTISIDDLQLGYRKSRIMEEGWIVLHAAFALVEGDPEEIRQEMDALREKRQEKQPLEFPSAGSTFKRPEGQYAGKLIMEAGLRGRTIGGAQVSEKHCGFIINRGHATAADVASLMQEVQKTVQDRTGIWLEPEVRFLGF